MIEFFVGFICMYWAISLIAASFTVLDRQVVVIQRGLAAVVLGVAVFFLTNSPV